MQEKLMHEFKNEKPKSHITLHTSHNSGITLVALIITIIVLLILAVVAIRAVQGDGIISHAKNASEEYTLSQVKEQVELAKQQYILEHNGEFNLEDFVANIGKYIEGATGSGTTIKIGEVEYNIGEEGSINKAYAVEKKVNAPLLKAGMTPVKYDSTNNCWVVTTEDDPEWYNYLDTNLTIDGKTVAAKTWANVMLQDGLVYDKATGRVTSEGSMYVWIPRYAYKITKLTEADYTTSKVTVGSEQLDTKVTEKAGTIDVVYLQGTSNNYEGGTAKRENVAETKYVVHPSFTSNVNLGGWDRELSGYWVAKFEAGYAGAAGNPSSAVDSTISYTENYGYNAETKVNENIKNNYYGANQIQDENDNFKKIKYPTFTGNKPSFNYISIGDAYSLCLSLNAAGNPYGINRNSDTHLMKNSEWGAVAYLAHSKYGRNGTEISRNVTIVSDKETNGTGVQTTWVVTGGNNYKGNQSQSTTGNIYGIYDLSGGVWERVASYINNNNGNITTYGASMQTASSTKYVTLYDKGTSDARVPNYIAAKKIYGDAVTETTLFDVGKTGATSADYYYNYYNGWFRDASIVPVVGNPFFERGGNYGGGSNAGSFAFNHTNGHLRSGHGFRAVLV